MPDDASGKQEVSVVVATHNQAGRLALVLAGLYGQTMSRERFEVVVVDDGCTDGTREVLATWQARLGLRVVSLRPNRGRCVARNEGVRVAQGDQVAFLDGDALPHPAWLAALLARREELGDEVLLCGGQWCLPKTEYLEDPRVPEVRSGRAPSVVRQYVRQRPEECVVTEDMVREDIEQIDRMALEGGYPFAKLAEVQRQNAELARLYSDSQVGWMAFSPHNGLVPRRLFKAVGGFDEEIAFSEGWELGYRLFKAGARWAFVPEAKTYHLYHYHGFGDPEKAVHETAVRQRAIAQMVAKHRDRRLWLIRLWQAGVWQDRRVPEEVRIASLAALHRRYLEATEEELVELERLLERRDR